MIRFEINGEQVDIDKMEDVFMAAMLSGVKNKIHDAVGSLRDPDTGEAPVVVVRGNSMDNLTLHVSASDKLLAIVKERLDIKDVENDERTSSDKATVGEKYIFLSYASEDKIVADKITNALQGKGADTFAYGYEGMPSTDIVGRISDAIDRCTDFVAVCSKNSLEKEWIKTEINSAIVQKNNRNINIILILLDIDAREMPSLYQVHHLQKWSDDLSVLDLIISDIYGITRKPEIGTRPLAVTCHDPGMRLSPAANLIVKMMIEGSENGDDDDPQLSPVSIREYTELNDYDIQDAVDELEGQEYVLRHKTLGMGSIGFHYLTPTKTLFSDFDAQFMKWNPEDDALAIAKKIVVEERDAISTSEIVEYFSWSVRRTNPAVNFLISRKIVAVYSNEISYPLTVSMIWTIPATRGFVRSRELCR